MVGEALGVGNPRRGVDESAEPGLEPAADRGEAVLAHLSGVAAVAGGEAGPQDRQDRRAPGTPGVAFPQFPAAVGEVIDAALVQPLVAAIHHPPVAPEHARVVGPEQGGGIVEAAAGADGVDGGLRGVTHVHSQWGLAPTRQPVSSGVTTGALRTWRQSSR